MAAPANTARGTPTGSGGTTNQLRDGYQTLIAFALDATVEFWEKTVQPPGINGGDPIVTNTMHNATYGTMAARTLVNYTPVNIVAAL